MTFAVFHDFLGLEYGLPKFHDFPGPVVTLINIIKILMCKPCLDSFLAHSKNELMQWRGVRRLSVHLSVNICANRFFSQSNDRIATKLAQDGLQVSMHPGCAEGQGQRSRDGDTRTFLDSWNELATPSLTVWFFISLCLIVWVYLHSNF